MNSTRTVIVLAAGEGKRMKSSLPKVLHPVLGRTLLGHVLAAAEPAGAGTTAVVVGHGADQVRAHLAEVAPDATTVLQAQQRGTGHAARVAMEATGTATGTVLVINGDVPLLRARTLVNLIETHEAGGAAATVLTAEVADPTGLGRIVRDAAGGVEAIVEERDATAAQRAIVEINAGVYVFDAALLGVALTKLNTQNAQGEEYLTDVIRLLVDAGHPVGAHRAADATEALGANDRAELATLRALLRDRINGDLMRSGVTMIDPTTTWVDVTVSVGRDAVIEPNTQLRGATVVGEGALVGPDTTLLDTTVGDGASVVRSHALGAEVGPGASVGPFAYLRPGTRLARKAKVGTFVETKNASLGEGAKIPHLTYAGDATVGAGANVGAGVIFANYDGVRKHQTVIGESAFIGCDSTLVAPVEVGAGAYVGAGTTVVKPVPPGALGVARTPQRTVDGWVERKRPGTRSAAAAAAAAGESVAGHAGAGGERSPEGPGDTATE
ncbi:bifunctional UDP-N-acetylglucosamine diphosphorylase/glucosamine-1-phosphate N-acetyltransferase GlmU [Luedemannella helvata]|uniref:Bifunctional protein GlmU n=1 Tax=Luedemannella helvata TaxID=349315 RepID=A0ABP4VSA7_9ACTN